MADKGFSSDFMVVQCYGGGIRVMSNSLNMSVLKLLLSADSNLTEISAQLGVPKTTVQACLSRLEAERILVSYPDARDSRSTRYSPSCTLIMSSGRFSEWETADYSDAVHNLYSDDAHVCNDTIMFYIYELDRHGICWHPFIISIGNAVGTMLEPECTRPGDVRDIVESVFGVELREFDSDGRLTFGLVSPIHRGMELIYMGFCVFGALAEILYLKSGRRYRYDPRVSRISDSEVLFIGEESPSTGFVVRPRDPRERDFRHYSMKDRFAILEAGGGNPVLVQNDTMLSILESIEEKPKSVGEIATELETRAVTIGSSVKRLVELGFVEPVAGRTIRNVKYRMVADRILEGDVADSGYVPGNVYDCITRFVDGETGFYQMVYEMNYFVLTCAGLRYDMLIYEVGRDAAIEIVRQNPGISAQEFLRLALKLYTKGRNPVRISSSIPVEFEIAVDPKADFNIETLYFRSLIKTGLREITGVEYPVWFKRVDRIDDSG